MAGQSKVKSPVPIFQDELELEALLKRVRDLGPKRILEVGSLYGGTLWRWMYEFCGATVVSVDLIADNNEHPKENILECRKHWERWAIDLMCLLHYYVGPSDHPEILRAAKKHAPYDFIFIDGGHKYDEISADFRNYWPMLRPGGLMAFHDVGYPESNRKIHVGRWWQEIKKSGDYRTEEFITRPNEWGIGLIWKPKK